jgi:hypothetical protein
VNARAHPGKVPAWLAAVAMAAALGLSAVRCDRNVALGVDPGSDAVLFDGGADVGD